MLTCDCGWFCVCCLFVRVKRVVYFYRLCLVLGCLYIVFMLKMRTSEPQLLSVHWWSMWREFHIFCDYWCHCGRRKSYI